MWAYYSQRKQRPSWMLTSICSMYDDGSLHRSTVPLLCPYYNSAYGWVDTKCQRCYPKNDDDTRCTEVGQVGIGFVKTPGCFSSARVTKTHGIRCAVYSDVLPGPQGVGLCGQIEMSPRFGRQTRKYHATPADARRGLDLLTPPGHLSLRPG